MTAATAYPWLESAWSEWRQRHHTARVPHALLLSGQAGLAKLVFARSLASAFLCEQPTDKHQACGQCRSCQFMRAGTHPDSIEISCVDDSKVIKIDQIRELTRTLSLTSQYGRGKVAILSPADAMNASAANSLLKTLEEPPGNTLLLLVSSQPSHLPATIRSRCQTLRIAVPTAQQARDWLQAELAAETDPQLLLGLCGGAPLAALALAHSGQLTHRKAAFEAFCAIAQGRQEPVSVAQEWSKIGLPVVLNWLASWAADLVRLRQTSSDAAKNTDFLNHLRKLAESLDLVGLHAWLQNVQVARRLEASPVVPQLLLEDILMEWIKVSVPVRR